MEGELRTGCNTRLLKVLGCGIRLEIFEGRLWGSLMVLTASTGHINVLVAQRANGAREYASSRSRVMA